MARSGFEVQKVTVEALFLREIRTRFGKFRLGYLWAILEPSAHLLILLGIFGYIMHRTMPDISFPVFLLNGLIPFFIFSSISNRSVGAIEANQGLFNYRPVKPIDTIIARALLETLIYDAVYILLMLIVWMAGEYFEITNFLQLVLTWSLLIILSLRFRVENLLILHLRQHFCHQPTVNKIPVLVIHYRPTSVKK